MHLHLFSFEDKEEGNELLRLIAKINAWPMAMFTEVEYESAPVVRIVLYACFSFVRMDSVEKKTMTYCVKDEAGRINASDVVSAVCK